MTRVKLFEPFLPQRRLLYHDIMESIVMALDAKDAYTADHSRRVGDMADLLCKEIGVKRKVKQQVHIAGHVHDIGKIGVPDHILNKQGKLTEEEWKLMQRHTSIGANILGQTKALKELSEIVLYHHERWDGRGYFGMKGEEIPLGARIIAVCDSIDAMVSNRAYRKAMSVAVCREEIEKNVGVMYDPRVAKIALENWNQLLLIKTEDCEL